MTACVGNIPAMILVGLPMLVVDKLAGHPPGHLANSSAALCMMLCTGVGCRQPRLRDAVLLTRDGDAVRRVDLHSRFLSLVDAPDDRSHHDYDAIATHDAGDVVVPAREGRP
jgi:hypothetical protein